MDVETPKLSRPSAAFAFSAAITVLFNTALACAKGAYPPLKQFMASLSDHDWTTQGLADVALFAVLGFIFWKLGGAEDIRPNRLVALLAGAVVIAGLGLFAWYAF